MAQFVHSSRFLFGVVPQGIVRREIPAARRIVSKIYSRNSVYVLSGDCVVVSPTGFFCKKMMKGAIRTSPFCVRPVGRCLRRGPNVAPVFEPAREERQHPHPRVGASLCTRSRVTALALVLRAEVKTASSGEPTRLFVSPSHRSSSLDVNARRVRGQDY
jgi:hypothetical protein